MFDKIKRHPGSLAVLIIIGFVLLFRLGEATEFLVAGTAMKALTAFVAVALWLLCMRLHGYVSAYFVKLTLQQEVKNDPIAKSVFLGASSIAIALIIAGIFG